MTSPAHRILALLRVAVPALALVTLAAACGGTPNSTLLPHLAGQRTTRGKLIIDVARGRFGPLHLGMSAAAARRELPANSYWKAGSDTGHQVYCSDPRSGYCGGDVELAVVSACRVIAQVRTPCTGNGPMGPVSEIDLFANGGETNQFLAPETQDAVTLRGIHLGSSIAQLKRKYSITATADATTCATIGAGGPTLTSVVGQNTVVFTKLNDKVYGITLFPGRQPHACNH